MTAVIVTAPCRGDTDDHVRIILEKCMKYSMLGFLLFNTMLMNIFQYKKPGALPVFRFILKCAGG